MGISADTAAHALRTYELHKHDRPRTVSSHPSHKVGRCERQQARVMGGGVGGGGKLVSGSFLSAVLFVLYYLVAAVLCVCSVYLVWLAWKVCFAWCFGVKKRARQPQALIVVGSPTVEVPCAAAAAEVFAKFGLDYQLVTCDGGNVRPDPDSLTNNKASKLAEARKDPVWFKVLQQLTDTMSLSRCAKVGQAAGQWPCAVFVTGGRDTLRQLRQADLKQSSPTPFCIELRSFCSAVLDAGGVVGATGHGVHGLMPEAEAPAGRRFTGNVDSAADATVQAMVAALAAATAQAAASPPATEAPSQSKKED